MAEFKCPIGTLIAQDENGDYVPFLMVVRDKEIIWSTDEIPQEVANTIANMNADMAVLTTPLPNYRLRKGKWEISVRDDGKIEMFREVKISELNTAIGEVIDSPVNNINRIIIPFPVKVGSESSSIQATLNTNGNTSLMKCVSNIETLKTDFGNIHSIRVNVFNLDGTEIDNIALQNLSIYIKIDGKISAE